MLCYVFNLQVTPHFVKTLERSKQIFENQLRDLEWRLDQESKVFIHFYFVSQLSLHRFLILALTIYFHVSQVSLVQLPFSFYKQTFEGTNFKSRCHCTSQTTGSRDHWSSQAAGKSRDRQYSRHVNINLNVYCSPFLNDMNGNGEWTV